MLECRCKLLAVDYGPKYTDPLLFGGICLISDEHFLIIGNRKHSPNCGADNEISADSKKVKMSISRLMSAKLVAFVRLMINLCSSLSPSHEYPSDSLIMLIFGVESDVFKTISVH